MTEVFDLAVIGAGPAGMAATIRARQAGLSVMVVDDQPAPGGQIWRAIEARAGRVHSAEDRRGLDLVARFRVSGADYRPQTQVWQVEGQWGVFLKSAMQGLSHAKARAVLIATGAQERPVPFAGWTLAGVTTLGAAQILLKAAGQVPAEPVWIAGCGPLALLYAVQLLDAGGQVAGFLDTTPADAPRRPALGDALKALPDLWRGLSWMYRLRGLPVHRGVTGLTGHEDASAPGRLAAVSFRDGTGRPHRLEVRNLLVHQGVVPRWHVATAIGCEMAWNAEARSHHPVVDAWAESNHRGAFLAGDGAGIAGAAAAVVHGEIAALGVIRRLYPDRADALVGEHAALTARRARLTTLRPFLDQRYAPSPLALPDETVVCRCENVTAGQIREAVQQGAAGPNQAKAYTRCGMGPCQGRQCAYAVASLIADATGQPAGDMGLARVRPPFRPITLGELASLQPEV